MNNKTFEDMKNKIISLTPRCRIKIYIENYDTGYELEIYEGDCQIKRDSKVIPDADFIEYISKITPEEFYLFSNDLSLDYKNISNVDRSFHFVLETRMLIIDTVFRSEESKSILNYSLYKHLNIYYNCRARSSNTMSTPKMAQALCRVFKMVYLATPAFTSYTDGNMEDYLGMNIDELDKYLLPVFTTNFESINSMPNQNTSVKTMNIYTFSGLMKLLKTTNSALENLEDEWVLADILQKTMYKEELFMGYWFADLLKCIIDPEFASQEITFRSLKTKDNKVYYVLAIGDVGKIATEECELISVKTTLISFLGIEIRTLFEGRRT